MRKSTKSRRGGKPAKPYADFPLFAHASGRWARKLRGSFAYFGRWGHKVGGKIVTVDDVEASAADAKRRFDREWPYLIEGRTPPPENADGYKVRDLCNGFLIAKWNRVESGELSLHSFSEYHRTTDRIIEFFGPDRLVDDLRPDDFERFRASLAKGCTAVTLKSKVNRCRVVFKYAADNRLIDRPVDYGTAFDRPTPTVLRHARNEAGPRMFDRDELLAMLAVADPEVKAMLLMGLNCGFGNSDISSLPHSALKFDSGWVEFPRPKTGVARKIPLWRETVEALRVALPLRVEEKDGEDAGLAFLTSRGTRYVRLQESKATPGKHVTINAIARRFELLMKAAKSAPTITSSFAPARQQRRL